MGLHTEERDEGAQEERHPSHTVGSCSVAAAAAQAPLSKSVCGWCKLKPEMLLHSVQQHLLWGIC